MSPYGITEPQWVNLTTVKTQYSSYIIQQPNYGLPLQSKLSENSTNLTE